MGELLLWLLLIAIGLIIVFYIVWIIVALLVRAFSIVVLYWLISVTLGAVAGVVKGVVLPVRVLLGRGNAAFTQLTPDDVVKGKAITGKPMGPNRAYGWDRAWPTYLPYQAREDARGVIAEGKLHLSSVWAWMGSRIRPGSGASTGKAAAKAASATARFLVGAWWVALLGPLAVAYSIALWVSIGAWLVFMVAIGLLTVLVQKFILGATKLADVIFRRRARASLKCPHCFGESTLPGYHCPNPDCTIIHWTVLPGPLGLLSRKCDCGQMMPNTVVSASRALAPVCPFCRVDLSAGSGARQTIQIPVIGSIGAGKTRLLDAAVTELAGRLADRGGRISGLTDKASDRLDAARLLVETHADTVKTPDAKAEGLPILIELNQRVVELQIMDVAGEAFATWETTSNLRYLDIADATIFVLDLLAMPEVNEQFRRSGQADSLLLAVGDQEETYAAAIDRLRADQIPIKKRDLAVVLSKADILTRLPIAKSLEVLDSSHIREWLFANGFDLLVSRFEKDFRSVTYFLTDSMSERETSDPMNPWWTLEWVLRVCKTPVVLVTPEPELETTKA